MIERKDIGVAISSGGVYTLGAGVGVLQCLEKKGIHPKYVAGASAGAVISALYYLEGNASKVDEIISGQIETINGLVKRRTNIDGDGLTQVIDSITGGRNWNDGKIKYLGIGAQYDDTGESVMLDRNTGLSLTDSLVATLSLKPILPTIKYQDRLLTHGGDPYYMNGLKNLDLKVIEVSVSGIIASIINKLSGVDQNSNIVGDVRIRPSFNFNPLIFRLNFSLKNYEYMRDKGYQLANKIL